MIKRFLLCIVCTVGMICGVSGATWAVQVEINPDPAVGNVKTYDGTPLTCDGGINVTDPSSGYTIRYGTTDGTYDLTTPPTRTEAGVSTIYYQITAENYDEKTGSYTCEVKVLGEVTLSEASGSIDYNQTKTITVTNNLSGGALSVVSSDDTIATAALNGSTITITPHSVGTVTITVVSDANGNYAASSTTYTLNITQHYNITYVMGGGTNYVNAPTQYEYGVGATINGTPTKNGYVFWGWCTDSELQNCATTQVIAANAIGDKTFYAKWIEAQFVVQTTSISSGGKFQFNMSAAGTFTVNCGEGGILSGEGVTGNTISRISDTSEATYTCTYSTGGEKTVTFSGRATAYNTAFGDKGADNIAAIRFIAGTGSNGSVASVAGSLGSIFPTLGSANGQQPRFFQTFRGSALTSIPSNLFDGVTGYTESMFRETFDRCASLISIPSDLFANVSGGAAHMFRSTFNLCTSLQAMPENLFATITTAADSLFKYSFFGNTAMSGYIPPSTFAGLVANNSPFVSKMWDNAFTGGNTLLTECPSGMQEYNLGYKGKSGWESKVSCTCGDNAYYDGSSCFTCPAGYDYNEDPGKTSINQCQIHCDAGTYLVNAEDTVCTDVGVGYYAEAATLSYGQTGTRGECPFGRTTSGATAGTSAESCNIITVSCEGANYLDANLECVPCPTGYDDDTTDGKTDISQCKIHCNAGTYIANSGDATCTNVESGYWAAAANIGYGESDTRNQCPAGSTTNGTNNTSILSCLCSSTAYMNNGVCESCPPGYDDNLETGKITVGQCQIHCEAGTYIHNQYDSTCTNVGIGYWAGESTVAYGQVGSRNECDEGTTTETETSITSAQCVRPQVVCPGTQYLDVDGETCLDCPHGYTSNTTTGKTDISQCQVRCAAGTWSGNFTEVPYLESTTQNANFIDTGYIIVSDNIEIDLSVSPISDTANSVDLGNIFGNQDGETDGFSGSFKNGVFGLWHQATRSPKLQSDSINPLSVTTIYNNHYTINGTTRTLKVNDAGMKTDERASATTSTTTIKLFSNGGSYLNTETNKISVLTQDKLFKGRIYSFKLKDNGVLKLDLIPARNNTTMQLGMYNRVDGAFYPNAGTGSFTTGHATSNNFASIACSNVGDGYYNGVNYTQYGSVGTRKQCPGGVATIVDGQHIDNATSISQCDGVSFFTCNPGYYLPANSNTCTICPINSYCIGGEYGSSDSEDQGLVSCPNNLFAPTGMWSSEQCGRKLHIGDNMLYLRSARKTTPSLNIDLNNDGIPDMFGNMTTQDVPMTAGTQRKLKLQYNNATYSVYDDSVTVGE